MRIILALRNLQFSVILYYKREMVTTSVPIYTYKMTENYKLRKAILSAFYNFSQETLEYY